MSASHVVSGIVAAAMACMSIACSEIVGIEDRSGRWCAVEADSHDFCEDFDRPEPFAAWSLGSGANAKVQSSDRSAPNAFLAENGVVIQRHFEASGEVALELDLLVLPTPPDQAPPMPTHDHGLALISRSGGSAGLFGNGGGTLFFGWLSGIPDATKIPASGRWARVGISIVGGEDAKQARLTVDGVVVQVAIRPPEADPKGENDKEGRGVPSDVILGSEILNGSTSKLRCEFDNVTVDLTDTDFSGAVP